MPLVHGHFKHTFTFFTFDIWKSTILENGFLMALFFFNTDNGPAGPPSFFYIPNKRDRHDLDRDKIPYNPHPSGRKRQVHPYFIWYFRLLYSLVS